MSSIDAARLLDRFLRYVAVDTTAREGTDQSPSSPGQLELGRLVARELEAAGADEVVQDEHGLVWAWLPPTVSAAPAIAWCAHLDTSPESPGAGVRPQVLRGYAGGDLPLPGRPGEAIRRRDHPELDGLRGCTLITSDGTTLLGADDKAGVAVIVETAAWLTARPEIRRGPIRIVLTCDEEIGRGAAHLDPDRLAAAACYTLDGPGADRIDVETFSADLAVVRIRGVNIHPSIAKGRMVNALKAAARFVDRLPREGLSPETTEGREGFVHPYRLEAGVDEAQLKVLLRDFRTEGLAEQAALLRSLAAEVEREFTGCRVEVAVQPQYRNMGEKLAKDPRAVAYALEAHRRLGRTARLCSIRGGTDGAQLTQRGVPAPNLAVGQHNPHSHREWACLEEMVRAAEVLVELARVWAGD